MQVRHYVIHESKVKHFFQLETIFMHISQFLQVKISTDNSCELHEVKLQSDKEKMKYSLIQKRIVIKMSTCILNYNKCFQGKANICRVLTY